MVRVKKGDKLICIPCGRQITVGLSGASETRLWCCGKPMLKKARIAKRKKPGKR